jgi:hypothetical protein
VPTANQAALRQVRGGVTEAGTVPRSNLRSPLGGVSGGSTCTIGSSRRCLSRSSRMRVSDSGAVGSEDMGGAPRSGQTGSGFVVGQAGGGAGARPGRMRPGTGSGRAWEGVWPDSRGRTDGVQAAPEEPCRCRPCGC